MLGGVLKKKTNSELTPPLYAHMPPMQPEQKKKKKRITPELIAGPGSGAQAMGPQMGAPATVEAVKSKKQKTGSSTGYLRVKRAADDQGATLQALRQATREHNSRYCIKVGGSKSELRERMRRVAHRFDVISEGSGGGGTAGQKSTRKAYKKIAKKYGKMTEDTAPDLAF